MHPQNCVEAEPFRMPANALYNSIQNKIQQLHGDFGTAAIMAGFKANYTNEFTRIGIVRCRQGPHNLVTSVIPFITEINSHKVRVNILYVGACLKKCFNFVKLHQERKCDEFCARLVSKEEKESFRDVLLNYEKTMSALIN